MHALDGGLLDALATAVAVLVVVVKTICRFTFRKPRSWSAATTDLFNGAMLVPFFTLASLPIFNWLAPIYNMPQLRNVLLVLTTSSPGVLGLAGGAGIFFVLSELFKFK